jgi:hypothetical protein
VFGVLIAIALVVVLVIVPYIFIKTLSGFGLNLGLPLVDLIAFGIILAALSSAAYIAKPTRAYGPLFATKSGVTLVYLFIFAGLATAGLSFNSNGGSGGGSVNFGWAALIWIVMIIPAIKLVAGLVTTVEDIMHPGERLPYDFPPEHRRTVGGTAQDPTQAVQMIESYVSQLEYMQMQGSGDVSPLQPRISAVSQRLYVISAQGSSAPQSFTPVPAAGAAQPPSYSPAPIADPAQKPSPEAAPGKACPSCGAMNGADFAFCEGCGNRFPDAK